MTTVLMKATEALAISRPSFEVGVKDAETEVADAINKAAEGGVTAIVVRLHRNFVAAITAKLIELGYQVTRHPNSLEINDQNFEFYKVDWTEAK